MLRSSIVQFAIVYFQQFDEWLSNSMNEQIMEIFPGWGFIINCPGVMEYVVNIWINNARSRCVAFESQFQATQECLQKDASLVAEYSSLDYHSFQLWMKQTIHFYHAASVQKQTERVKVKQKYLAWSENVSLPRWFQHKKVVIAIIGAIGPGPLDNEMNGCQIKEIRPNFVRQTSL